MGWRVVLGVLAAVVGSACEPPPITVVVNLRTNLRPTVEFTRVEAALYSGRDSSFDLPRELAPAFMVSSDADALTGIRAAEFSDVEEGLYYIRVRLLEASGEEVGHGLSLAHIDSTRIVTVVVDRACGGVSCPGDGSPNEVACLGGQCVDPLCPNDPSRCPEARCLSDEQCAVDGPECVRGACIVGICVSYPDDARCGGATCDRVSGCGELPDAGPVDGGPRDAGPVVMSDAGQDAGMDAGLGDAGRDAGQDAGPDAGSDAGPDAGPPDAGPLPCTQISSGGTNIGWPQINAGFPTWDALPAGNCGGAPTGQTPYYYQTRYCNLTATPRSVTFDIIEHANEPEIVNPSMWGWLGDNPTGAGACHFAITGIGSVGPEITLQPGEYLTLRVGSSQTGATGWTGGSTSP